MKKEALDRACRLSAWVLAALVLLCGLLLVVSCVRIGLSGNAPYTRERVVEALSRLAIPLWLTVAVALFGGALHITRAIVSGEGRGGLRGEAPAPAPRFSRRGQMITRVALLVAALALILLGILNGSMRDVLEKAVRICTECIGLG